MRLKCDEVMVLRSLASGAPLRIASSRARSIIRTFCWRGLVDALGHLTKSGRHVAAKLPPAAEPLEEITEFEEWD